MSVLAETVEQMTGIVSPEYRWPVLQAELERLSAGEPQEALRGLQHRHRATARLLHIASIPETYLFRHTGHFTLLHQHALDLQAQGRPCRVLSAGCSTGEEVWSAAAVLASVPAPCGCNHSVIGWELCEERLQRALTGRYNAWSCRDGFADWSRFFKRDADGFRVTPELHELAHFQQVNLVSGLLPAIAHSVDVLLFRNVAMYWRQETVERVWRHLVSLLGDDAVIFVGPSDPVPAGLDGWQQQISHGVRSFRKARTTNPQAGDGGVGMVTTPGLLQGQSPRRSSPSSRSVAERAAGGPGRPAIPGRRPSLGTRGLAVECDATAAGAASPQEPLPEAEAEPLDRVRRLADSGEYQAALDLLDNDRSGITVTVDGKLWRGILALNLGDTRLAVRMLRQCVFLRRDEPELRSWLAVAYRALGRYEEAEREQRNAQQLREARS